MTYQKQLFFWGIISLILLPNHDILNWLFAGTILVVWKQVLAIILWLLSIKIISTRKLTQHSNTKNIKILFFTLALAVLLSFLTSLMQGLSLHRIVYAIFAYIGFFGGTIFALVIIMQRQTLFVLRVASVLGIFSSLGLIVDYFTSWFDFLPRSGGMGIEEQLLEGHLRRAIFLFGAPTVIFPFLSFSILSSVILYISKVKKTDLYYFPILLIFSPIAIFFTGSRSQLLLIILLFILFLLLISRSLLSKRNFIISVIFLTVFGVAGKGSINTITQLPDLFERYNDPFGAKKEGNDTRFIIWQEGVALFTNFDETIISGVGLGSSMGMVDDGRESTSHYESSFFQAYSEAGYLGLILRFYPGILALFYLLKIKTKKNKSTLKKLFSVWFLLYFASIFSSPTAAEYSTQFVYFLMVGFSLNMHKLFTSIKPPYK